MISSIITETDALAVLIWQESKKTYAIGFTARGLQRLSEEPDKIGLETAEFINRLEETIANYYINKWNWVVDENCIVSNGVWIQNGFRFLI